MKLSEVLNSRQDLTWFHDDGSYHADFFIDDRKYGISASKEELEGLTFLSVDFHFEDSEGKIHHEATGFNKDAGKVLGIVGNGIREKFKEADCIYFLAKLRTGSSSDEYNARCKLYSRLLQKLSVELNLRSFVQDLGDEKVFALCKNNDVIEKFKDLI
jgi:hypothetical protein